MPRSRYLWISNSVTPPATATRTAGIRAGVRQRQPPYTTGTNTKWVRRGLVSLLDMRECAHDHQQGFCSTVTGNGAVKEIAGLAGSGYTFGDGGTTKYVVFPYVPTSAFINAMTVVAMVGVNTLTNYGGIASRLNYGPPNNLPDGVEFDLRISKTGTDTNIALYRGNVNDVDPGILYGPSDLITLPFTGAIGVVAKGRNVSSGGSIWVGSKKYDASISGTGGPDPTNPSLYGYNVGGNQQGTGLDGMVYFVALFSRALSDGEMSSLMNNPWDVFEPDMRRHFFIPNTAATNYTLPCTTGSYTITGNATTLRKASDLIATAGSYAITGNAATLKWARVLSTVTASYVETGVAAALKKQWVLTAASGTYTMTGNTTGLIYSGNAHPPMTAVTGTYAITGNAVTLRWNKVLSAVTNSYVMTGNTTALTKQHKLPVTTGTYTITGNATILSYKRVFTCDRGSYIMTGRTCTLRYSGAPGNAVTFFQGVSKAPDQDGGVSKTIHTLTPTGGGYTVVNTSGVSEDKTDSTQYEGYIVAP